MTTTNKPRFGGRAITGICLTACGILTIVWGGTLVPVSMFSGDFMSFVTGGLVLIALGTYLVTALPPSLRIAAVWLAALGLIAYLFVIGMETIVALIGCVPVVGFAAWLSTRLWR
ncbi:MAG: hypothetical protein Q3979_07115 [Actinomycetaceae bacterium]|nr:hypothetical protein [Actinomycetaceae bacterium]